MVQILTSYDDLEEEGKRLVFVMKHYMRGSPEYNSAFNDIYRLYYSLVFKVAYRELEDYQLAEDAAHDAFIRFIRNGAGNFRMGCAVSSYLGEISKNAARNIRTKLKKNVPEIDIDELPDIVFSAEPSPEAAAIETAMADVLYNAIEKLPLKQRHVLTLKLDEYEVKEISQMTDNPVGTIKSGLFYTRKKLGENPELATAYG